MNPSEFVGPARSALGGQLLIGAGRIAWLLAPPEAELVRPDRVEWRAERRYRESRGTDYPFLPRELQQERPPIHAFLALGDEYVNAGPAHLGYGYSSYDSLGEASLTLLERVSYDTWVALGGYPEFNLTLDDVRASLAAGAGQLDIVSYDKPALTLLINPERVFVMYDTGNEEWLVAGDPAAGEEPEAFTLDNGQVDEFPRSQTVTHAEALDAADTFLRTGALSERVSWRPDP